ncbi:rootletin-like [Manihot esculenta]|uniref:rootletin-like n=1 Tax=Manihot esculenta TaxID=3983 RepID=UPI001CC56EC8|nr:rootletin-like [Manihot esculenta]
MPRGDCRIGGPSAVSSEEESESDGEDLGALESEGGDPKSGGEDLNPGLEIAPVVDTKTSDPKDAGLPPDTVVNKHNVGEDVLTNAFTPMACDASYIPGYLPASGEKMDQIKPLKNFTLSRESMNVALDALLAGRSVGEATQEVAEVISSRSASRPPAPASTRASKPSSRGTKSSRPSSRSRSSSVPQTAQAPRSQRVSTEGAKKAPRVTPRPVEDTEPVKTKPALPSDSISGERLEAPTSEERVLEGGTKIIPAGEGVQGAPVEAAPVTEKREPGPVNEVVSQGTVEGAESGSIEVVPPQEKSSAASKGPAKGVGSKRPPPSKALAPAPVSKKARASRRTTPALPPLEKKKTLMAMGVFMEIDARDRALRDSVDRRIEEARLEENLSATSDARSNLAAAQEHSKSLQIELYTTREALKKADGRTAEAENQRDEALKEEALAQVVVLEQELTKWADSERDLALAVETFKLQSQHLCQEVEILKKRCAALLEDAKHAEDRVQLECEERLREYKESTELKEKIEQACEAHLQSYKDSLELKAKIAKACEERLAEFKASGEMKTAIWNKGFRMFVSGYNRGLRIARYAPSTPLAELQAAEEDSDGEEVLYGEDDRPLPKGASRTVAGPSEADAELGKEDEGAGPQRQEIVPFVGTGGSVPEGARPPIDSNVNNVNVDKDSVDDDVPRHVSPLRTVFPSVE